MGNSKDINYNNRKIITTIFWIIIGNILSAIAYNICFTPNQMLSAGVGGIALMAQYLLKIPSGIAMLIINIPIFILGFKKLDRDFSIYSIISTIILSVLLTLTKDLGNIIVIDDILVGAVLGGVLNGIGMGLIFRNRASQGGFDIPGAILKKKYNINISSSMMMINIVIISLSSLLFSIKSAVYTLIALFISYQVLDKVQIGFNNKKNIMIITDKYEEVGNTIMEELGRSVTYLEAVGGYKKDSKRLVYCILVSKEVAKLKEIIDRIDSSAFLIINDVVEVEGSTFTKIGI